MKFCKHNHTKSQLPNGRWYCKICTSKSCRQYRKSNRDKISKTQMDYRKKHRSLLVEQQTTRTESSLTAWLTHCWQIIKCPNKKRSNPYTKIVTIDLQYILDLVKQQNNLCALTKLPLAFKQNDPHSASIDRIDNNQGYIPGNIHIIAQSINLGRSSLPLSIFIPLLNELKGLTIITSPPPNTNGKRARFQNTLRGFLFCKRLRAKESKKDNTITTDDLLQLYNLQNGKCALTNQQMFKVFDHPKSISIDRIDSSIGYQQSNIQLVCSWVNKAKKTFNNNIMKTYFDEIATVQ